MEPTTAALMLNIIMYLAQPMARYKYLYIFTFYWIHTSAVLGVGTNIIMYLAQTHGKVLFYFSILLDTYKCRPGCRYDKFQQNKIKEHRRRIFFGNFVRNLFGVPMKASLLLWGKSFLGKVFSFGRRQQIRCLDFHE